MTGAAQQTLDPAAVEAAVAAAVKAPSILNSQPWRFHAHGEQVDVFAVPERAPSLLDPAGREVYLSVGAAVLNLRLAIGAAGRAAVVELVPSTQDQRFAATVHIAGPTAQPIEDRALFEAIPDRRTSRMPFTEQLVKYEEFDRLQEAAALEGAHLEVTTGLHRAVVTDAMHAADRAQRADRALVDEVSLWTVDRDGAEGVGIPAESLGPRPTDPHAMVRDLAFGRPVADRPTADFERSTLMAVLLTSGDHPVDWVRAGMALERVLLTATARGLSVGLLSQAVEVPDLRWLVRDPASGWRHPQIVLRIGHGETPPPTPRLPVSDVFEVD